MAMTFFESEASSLIRDRSKSRKASSPSSWKISGIDLPVRFANSRSASTNSQPISRDNIRPTLVFPEAMNPTRNMLFGKDIAFGNVHPDPKGVNATPEICVRERLCQLDPRVGQHRRIDQEFRHLPLQNIGRSLGGAAFQFQHRLLGQEGHVGGDQHVIQSE